MEKKTYTHDGQTLTIAEWSRELGMNSKTMWTRLKKYKEGKISETDCFAPVAECYSQKVTQEEQAESMNKRHRCVDALFSSFIKWGLPKIDGEMKTYMKTGEVGNALNFFLKYQKYFSAEAYDNQQKNQVQQLAQFANIFVQKQDSIPASFTKLN